MSADDSRNARPGLLRHALAVVADHPRHYLVAALLVQGPIALIGIPAAISLFGLLDAHVEITSPTPPALIQALTDPFADLLLLALALVAALLAYLEFATMSAIALRHRCGDPVTLRGVVGDLIASGQRLGHPSSLLLVPYLLLVLPGGPVGLVLLLGPGVRVPDFVDADLLASAPLIAATVVVTAGLLFLAVRLLPTVPVFVREPVTVGQAIAASRRATRGRFWRLAGVSTVIAGVALVLIASTFGVGMLPVRWADAAWPPAAPVIAALALTLTQAVAFAVAGAAVAVLANVAVDVLPGAVLPGAVHDRVAARRTARRPARTVVAALVALAVVAGLAATNLATVRSLIQLGDTLVIAHRGLLTGGVENTIPALEAAVAIHPDLVEIDIQQTADDRFVVLHDPDLMRLAGRPDRVRDLTLEQLQGIRLEQNGRTAPIDSLDDYLERSVELGQRLLIEFKINGDESEDYLDLLIATLQRHDVLDRDWVHSLDKPTIEAFEAREPQVPTGYIMMFNLGHAPRTTTDFVVMQELSYTRDLRDEVWAADKGLLLWSVDDVPTMLNSLRDDVDGLISYQPDVVQQQRERVRADTGVADRVSDAVLRLVGW